MAKRSPNRRRKSPRKSSPQNTIPDMHYQDASNGQGGYPSYNMPGFSEDSIQRQLGGYMVLPPTFAPAQANMWQPGCWYPYTHPATGEEVAVWYDDQYAHVDQDYSYGRKHKDGCERFWHQGDCYVRPDTDWSPGHTSLPPPLYQYVEGYHDPILKGLAPDWWRLFGHDVPKQFILSPTSAEEADAGSEPKKAKEKENDGEWDAAAYFGPYRASDTEACRGSERAYGEEEAKGKDRREKGEDSVNGSTTKKPIEGYKRECRGRDDWECDFCGMECFCWTVKKEKRPADDIQSPRMRLYMETYCGT